MTLARLKHQAFSLVKDVLLIYMVADISRIEQYLLICWWIVFPFFVLIFRIA